MTKQFCADVFIAGLGPAGASAAHAAAAAGLSVIAVDRKAAAGQPVQCAEFVPAMLSPIEQSVPSVRRQSIEAMQTFVETASPHWQENFPGVMIDRGAFDAEIVAKAIKAGADCRFQTALAELDPNGEILLSNGDCVSARIVIGADGPRSKIGAAIGVVNQDLVVARQYTVPFATEHPAVDIFLSSEYTGGYAWLFPRGEKANIGIGVIPDARDKLPSLLDELHAKLKNEGRVGGEIFARTGGYIPVGGILDLWRNYGQTPVVLCGDAAGLTNPITGAGISSAVISGTLAGETAAAYLSGEGQALEEYAEEILALFNNSQERALAHRRTMLDWYRNNYQPSDEDLRKTWITHPEYWAA